MACYVDKLRNWGWTLGPSCHLYADTNEELHALAARLGMRREWFQKTTSGPHYDLTAKKRALAVRLGAIEQTDREMVDHMNRWTDEAVAAVTAAPTEEGKAAARAHLYR